MPDTGRPAELRRLANEHWRGSYRVRIDLLNGEWREFGAVQAYSTRHLDYAFVNGCIALDPADPADLGAAIEWLSERPVGYRVWIDVAIATPEMLAVPVARGLETDATWLLPAMVLPRIPVAPPPPAGVKLRRVDEALAVDLPRHLAEADSPHSPFLESLTAASIDSDRLAVYVAELDGRFAATSAVIRTGASCGIYAVGTAEWARRRGVGTAVTWATLEHARTEWGCTCAALQSSPVGVIVYEKMGFRLAAQYQLFDASSPR